MINALFAARPERWETYEAPLKAAFVANGLKVDLRQDFAPEDVDYINAHGTSTMMNDASETRGIHRAFGAHGNVVRVSSTKSMTGHLVAACGAVEAIYSLLACRDGVLPPTANLDRPDPECNLAHVPKVAERQLVRRAMTNAFGFGGSNGTLVVSARA